MIAESEHIAIIGPAYPYRGGIAHFSDSLAGALRARDHDVAIFTFSRQYPGFLFPGKTQLEAPLEDAPPATRPVIDSVNPLTWVRTARRIIDDGARLAVIAYWLPFFAPAYATMAWLLRRNGVKVIGLVHNALPHSRHPGDRLLSRTFFGMCDRLVVLSSSVAADVASLDVATPVVEAHHPVYAQFGERMDRADARRRLEVDPDAPLLLFFGFVRHYKGLHVLIEALPAVVARHPAVQLVVAGEFYDGEPEIRQRVRELGLEPHVRFDARYIPETDVRVYFSAADVLVQPYITATQSGVAHIAFNFGVPLIVTDVGALGEVVPDGEAGIVVPPENPVALARAIDSFLEDGALRAHLVTGVERQRRRFSWEALCALIESHPSKHER